MLETNRVPAMFAEAHSDYAEALNKLDEASKVWDREMLRKSAAKTWEAALQATNALLEARAGVEAKPDDDDWTYDCLMRMVWEDSKRNQDLKPIKGQYAVISHDIYQEAVVEGKVDPVYLLIHDIRQTAGYIAECERLAGVGDGDG